MSNILEYIKWRGDLSIKQDSFNEVDNLILSRLSYLPFDNIFFGDKKVTIKDAYSRAMSIGIPEDSILQKEDNDLFETLAKSKRFGELYITDFVNIIDVEEEKQFSAVTIIIPDNTIYIAYRGTDNTLIGWKEDFNMSFSSNVSSQQSAVEYLEGIGKQTKRKIRIGGHSKGGNLAVFASVFCSEKTKKQIIEIYNNDGPGMSNEVITKKEYKEIVSKIHTYIPQSSIIGRLLYHKEKDTIVKSIQKGIMQHDLYSWQVLGNNFITLEELTDESELADKVIKGWLDAVTPKQREEFIDIIYQIFTATKVNTVNEISSNWLRSARILLKAYTTIDEESKKIISETLSEIFNITKRNLLESTIQRKRIKENKK